MEMSKIIKLLDGPWQDRVQGEYLFIKDKATRLKSMLKRYATGKLDFNPDCSFELLLEQYNTMMKYLTILEMRMHIEHIDIPE